MGGKNKQRTKGNVRPSSSGRAAELLARERGSLPGFVGFESSETSSDAVYVPAVQGAEDIDSLVDAEFRVVLRKLSKRDSVTKLKAIQEFGSMCQEKDAETVKGVLPYWPRIYCKISGDHDRRVREATQQALQQLVLKVKRNLAPYLKSIMGHWLVAQCDTYSPAASAACTAFHAAFPCNKQAEALGFCKEEVLNILQDNLLKETPETLSDPQSVPMEERMAKYVRLVTSSLVAVKLLVSTLTPQDLDALSQRLAHLISHTKFWKYGKHRDSSQIRRAFFEAVVALCERTPQLVQAEAGQACPTVLLSIDDTDPGVLPMLWEAVRLILYCIPDCWVHVNVKKGVLPKLWLLLREGGHGLATDFYPNLLPFLSKLPHEVTEYPLQFYTTFFSALIQGLSTKRASRSVSESGAIVTAAMECLRFTVLQTITSSQGSDSDEEEEQAKDSQQVCSMLLNEQLLPLVDCAMLSPILQNGPLFTQIKQMLLSWEKRATCPSEPHRSTFQQLLLDFWEGLQSLCVRLVDEVGGLALEGVAVLLQSMRGSSGATRGAVCNRKKAVCFADVTGTDRNAEENASHVHLANGDLEKLVCRLAEVSMVHVSLRDSDKHLCFLSVLLASFPDRRVFRVLLDLPDSGTDDHNPATSFLMQKVVVWLGGECGKDPGILVDMVFSALQCCGSQEEKTAILEHITQMDLAWGVLLQILQKGSTDLEAAAGWLKGSVLGGRLVGVAEELCTSGLRKPESTTTPPTHSHGWALVSLVLSQQQDGETLISKEHVVKILDRLHATLSDAKGLSDAGDMEPLVSFICDVASNFFSVHGCLLPPSAEELLLTVFQLCAQEQEVTHLSDSMLDKLKQALLAGILSLVSQGKADVGDGIFLRSAASWVHNQLLTSCFGVKSLQVLVSSVQSLVEVLVGLGQQGLDLMVQFVNHLMPTVEEWERMRRALPPQWVRCPLLSGRVRVSRSYLCMDRLSSRLPAHLSTSAVLGRTVYTALCATSKQEPELPRLPDLKHIAMEVLYALQWCEEMESCPTVVSEYCHLVQDLNVTRECVSKEMGLDGDLLQALFAMSVIVGGLWALTLGAYIQTLAVSSADLQNFCGSMQSLFPLTEARLNTLQVICPYLSADERDSVVSLATAALLSWQESDQHSIQSGMLNLAALHCGLEGGTCADEELLLAVVTTLMEWRNSKAELFLFSGDLNCVSAGLLSLNVEMMRFLCWLAAHCPTVLQEPQWDFLLCSVLAWLETATENTSAFWNPLAQLFVSQDCDLIVTLSEFFSAPPTGAAEHLPPKLTSEWDEFFMEGIHSRLLALLVRITEEFSDPDEPVFPMPVLRSVGEALRSTPVRLLTQNTLAPRFVADQRSSLPDPLQTLLNTLAPLLLFKARPVQITAFHILHKVMPQLPEYDTEGDGSRCDEDDGEEPSLSPPAALMTILAATEELLDNILSSVQVGEFAVVQPLSEEYSCILGYLLTWKLILTFFKASPSQLRVQYSMYLRKSHLLNKLLLHLFRLMPEIPVLPEPGGKTFFTESLDLPVRSCSGLSRELPHLACSVYYTTLKDLPAMVRLWWNGQDKRVFSTVDKFTSKYVSSVLSSQELAAVHVSTQTFEYMTVKARTAAREVIATYSVDDIFIELVIQLPQNYPLGSISVESGRRVGVAVQQWRNWLLQLSTYLTHQNGSIMEGLALWKNNVDKRFEGVEDCMICFSVIHGSNYSLPKKACRTCKKKFHSACLYKWFTSSNKSTCPLCRETFF